MSVNTDLDPHLIKCIGFLYESRKLRKGDPVPLQYILEDAILQKTGVVKDYTDFFQSQLPSRESEEPSVVSTYDDKGKFKQYKKCNLNVFLFFHFRSTYK